MEKAILKTLIYADIFDYPLKAWEIHKWLIGKKGSLKQVEKALNKSKVKSKNDFYFQNHRAGLVGKRLEREKVSQDYLRQAQWVAQLFKVVPFIKLVGVSGSLAMDNADKSDDIDLFIITIKNRLWISRILLLLILEFLGKRRKRGELLKNAAGKICINILLEEDQLAQENRDIYLAHEVLQMRPLWARDGIYQKFLEENDWAFKFLPNWVTTQKQDKNVKIKYKNDKAKSKKIFYIYTLIFNFLEEIFRFFQLRYMGQPTGKERISDTALYFHPQDIRGKVLTEYQKRIKNI